MRGLLAGLCLVGVLFAPACGGSPPSPPPTRVADALAPAQLGDKVKLYENKDKATLTAFANAGSDAVMADGRIWELRRADRLIGTLQITTLVTGTNLRDPKVRQGIAQQIIGGSLTRLRVEGTEVFATDVDGKGLYVWFGEGLFEVMQIKDTQAQDRYEELVAQVLQHQATVSAWKPIVEGAGA